MRKFVKFIVQSIAAVIVVLIVGICSVAGYLWWYGQQPHNCPKCHVADMVIPISYGLRPADSVDTTSKVKETFDAGCELGLDQWYCKRCQNKFF